ncbi:MAG: hypothetical protein LBF00_01890 [Mycoplasmataceae bacterium]|jgi:hypothetical protein|nr:hypothetical protein [Mycoplasmataceae bacterium]
MTNILFIQIMFHSLGVHEAVGASLPSFWDELVQLWGKKVADTVHWGFFWGITGIAAACVLSCAVWWGGLALYCVFTKNKEKRAELKRDAFKPIYAFGFIILMFATITLFWEVLFPTIYSTFAN